MPPRAFFVEFQESVLADGSREIMFANGTTVTELPPLPFDASEFEKATAPNRITSFGNGTEIMNYRNGTVAIFENGQLMSYIVAPKSLFVTVTVIQNEDGSYTRYISNGTNVWFGPPASLNETAEIRAFRVVSIRSEPNG